MLGHFELIMRVHTDCLVVFQDRRIQEVIFWYNHIYICQCTYAVSLYFKFLIKTLVFYMKTYIFIKRNKINYKTSRLFVLWGYKQTNNNKTMKTCENFCIINLTKLCKLSLVSTGFYISIIQTNYEFIS